VTATRTAKPPDDALTPAMRQYAEQKQQAGDAILLFRMGDFYETFFDDAHTLARVLGVALTSRSKDKSDQPIPLAGFPHHALEGYLTRLVRAGYRAAVSEQVEDPRQAKGVVRREIVRIVTAGTLTDDALLDQRADNVLLALHPAPRGPGIGLAAVELSSGRFQAYDPLGNDALDLLVRLAPAEMLLDEQTTPDSPIARLAAQLRDLCGAAVTRRPPHEFSPHHAERTLLDHFGVATLAGFGFDRSTPSLQAAGAILDYLKETQKTALTHIAALSRHASEQTVQIDHCTWRSLEIERTLRSGTREGSLLAAVDRTVHPLGARQLRRWLCAPLRDPDAIRARQAAVACFVEHSAARRQVRVILKKLADVERIAARVAMARATPRDLAGLGAALKMLPELQREVCGSVFEEAPSAPSRDRQGAVAPAEYGPLPHGRGSELAPPARPDPAAPVLLVELADACTGLDAVADLLEAAIRPDAPHVLREGGIIRDGFDAELDRLHAVGRDGQDWLARYQQQQGQATGIASLKVGFNRVFGYYIEVSHAHQPRVPANYVRKQTVKNAERYITDELKRFETEALTAQEQANDLETALFENVRSRVAEEIQSLRRAADAIAQLDAFAALAELAVRHRYVRPILVESPTLHIDAGRHPVLEQTLTDPAAASRSIGTVTSGFVPNDCRLDADDARLLVITGPNMAGKSTYIRQVALITLLAQTGSFVPAEAMTFSPVDRLFARVGASDEITRGQSTFMVEMTEAANIIHNATERSLVVIDELGRGTSTFDGLALAWAITEHLANHVRCLTLMATHYHELTELADLLRGVRNCNVAVRECPDPAAPGGESIVFLHRIVPGGTDKSYGLHVAHLAGVPAAVVARGREVLAELERGFSRETHSTPLSRRRTRDDAQLPLFSGLGE